MAEARDQQVQSAQRHPRV